jgi:hypothetical protein
MSEASSSQEGVKAGAVTMGLIFSNARILINENLLPVPQVWIPLILFNIVRGPISDQAALVAWQRAVWSAAAFAISWWLTTPVTRALLGYDRGFWKWDADFWRSARAFFLLSATVLVPFFLATAISIMAIGIRLFPLSVLVLCAAVIFAVIVSLRGLLWPVGLLIGENEMTYAKSELWMRGSVWPTLIAFVIVGLIFGTPQLFVAHSWLAADPLWRAVVLIPSNAIAGLGNVLAVAMTASVFATLHLSKQAAS